jgi:hypothetical protein
MGGEAVGSDWSAAAHALTLGASDANPKHTKPVVNAVLPATFGPTTAVISAASPTVIGSGPKQRKPARVTLSRRTMTFQHELAHRCEKIGSWMIGEDR